MEVYSLHADSLAPGGQVVHHRLGKTESVVSRIGDDAGNLPGPGARVDRREPAALTVGRRFRLRVEYFGRTAGGSSARNIWDMDPRGQGAHRRYRRDYWQLAQWPVTANRLGLMTKPYRMRAVRTRSRNMSSGTSVMDPHFSQTRCP